MLELKLNHISKGVPSDFFMQTDELVSTTYTYICTHEYMCNG